MNYLVKFLYIIFFGAFRFSAFTAEHLLVVENGDIVSAAHLAFQTLSSRVVQEVSQLVQLGIAETSDQQHRRLKSFFTETFPNLSHSNIEEIEIYLYAHLIKGWKESFVEHFLKHEKLNKTFLRALCEAAATKEELVEKRGSRAVHSALKQQENDLITLAVATFPVSLLDGENLSLVTPALIQTLSDQNLLKLVNLQKDCEGRNLVNLVARNLYLNGWRLKLIHLHPLETLARLSPQELFERDRSGFNALSWLRRPFILELVERHPEFKHLYEEDKSSADESSRVDSQNEIMHDSFGFS